ncbi:indolepyruvate ferredoxin oxidoreductase subunit alpha [bacterium]|nr:indolepyruvate ferredoxin oxidoreductase subunit alpha [bacterium]
MSKEMMSGNEAIARAAYEAGVKVAAAYPGTPSSEIMENVAKYDEIFSQWGPNEKVAFEVALGAAFAGKRAICAMKHVGLNVAADPFFTASYSGVEAGFVIVSADEPGMHSSQNEQDNRNYAKFAKIPMLEPSDSQEAKDFTKLAFDISEKFDTPVLMRVTTRICHSKSMVELKERKETGLNEFPKKNTRKYVVIPAHARIKRVMVEQRLKDLAEYAENTDINRIEEGTRDLAFITSGFSHNYVKEVYPDAHFLKLGFTYPLPMKMIRKFVDQHKKVIVVEELDPFMEDQIKVAGINVHGMDIITNIGELNSDIIRNSIENTKDEVNDIGVSIPVRPPALCPGCPHRGVFTILREQSVRVMGDIGCYTLGVLPPLDNLDWCVCMGAGVSMVQGLEKAWDDEHADKIVGMVGDSTFFHSGITGLVDIVYNHGIGTIFVLDNSTTAMTGTQENPATGKDIKGKPATRVDIRKICEAVGIKEIYDVDPQDLDALGEVVAKALASKNPTVIITHRECILLPLRAKVKFTPLKIDTEKCIGCKSCVSVGCPALAYDKKLRKTRVLPELCVGCEVCSRMCPKSAFTKNGEPLVYEKRHKIRGK